MVHATTKLSIVCPAYEEQEVLPLFHAELDRVLRDLNNSYDIEILYVDDGSRDRTLAILERLAQADARVRFLSLSRNFGHQAALTAGLEHASGDVTITLDCDLQHPPHVIPLLLQQWQSGYEVVLTNRRDDTRLGFTKRLPSRWFYRLMGLISDVNVPTGHADFRLMSRTVVQQLLQMRERHRFLRGMVQWLGFPSTVVDFEPAQRRAGASKYTLRKMLRLAADGIFSFSRAPLRLAAYLGLGSVALSLCGAATLLVHAVAADAPGPAAWQMVLLSIYFVGGCILTALGLMGEHLGRIHDEVLKRPLYAVKCASRPHRAAVPESESGSCSGVYPWQGMPQPVRNRAGASGAFSVCWSAPLSPLECWSKSDPPS